MSGELGELDGWIIGGVALLIAFLAGVASTTRRKRRSGNDIGPPVTPSADGLTDAASANTDEHHGAEVRAVTDAATGADSARVLADMINTTRRKR
jgi:hypothetical protein